MRIPHRIRDFCTFSLFFMNIILQHLTRKSSTTSSTGSLHVDKKKHLFRKDSEVKMEAIFKELFSPDAKIVDHFDGEMLMM